MERTHPEEERYIYGGKRKKAAISEALELNKRGEGPAGRGIPGKRRLSFKRGKKVVRGNQSIFKRKQLSWDPPRKEGGKRALISRSCIPKNFA